MRGEMGMQNGDIEYFRRNRREISNMTEPSDDAPAKSSFPGRLIPSGWFYQNELRCARMMVEYYIPVADVDKGTFSPELVRRGTVALSDETRYATPYNLMERMLLPGLGAAKKFAYAQASVNLARTAIALERHRLTHGEFPETLDALAPQFIAQVPHDVIGGGPLKYRREADGQFVLYSVGWNETDDGGVVVFTKGNTPHVDNNKGDWVWRYPQKE
jgi:hypothetical protein